MAYDRYAQAISPTTVFAFAASIFSIAIGLGFGLLFGAQGFVLFTLLAVVMFYVWLRKKPLRVTAHDRNRWR